MTDKPDGSDKRDGRYIRVASTLAFGVFFIRLVRRPSDVPHSLLATLVDVAILGGLAGITAAVVHDRSRHVRVVLQSLYIAIVFVFGSLLFWHAYYLDIGGAYEFSPIGLTPGTILFFAVDMVPKPAWLLFAGFWLFVFSSWRWTKFDWAIPPAVFSQRRSSGVIAGACSIALAAGIAMVPGVQHPLTSLIAGASGMSTVIRAGETTLNIDHLNLRRTGAWPVESRFQRVLVFVMEGVSRREFDAALSGLQVDGGFFRDVASFATKYNGVFTVNQESRTARTAMVHSVMIPWEAYVANWAELYGWIYEDGGMVELLNGAGWNTAVAIPLIDLPWDLRRLPWRQRLTISEAEFRRSAFTCLAPTEYDRGCEDGILLDRIEALLAEPGPTFLFQPFLFGHTSKWEESAGIGRVQYYDRYLGSVLALLRRLDLLDETLIVVTSDHGPRLYRALSDVDSYEVPLWFVHPSFPAEVRSGHFANTEFRDLVLESMRDGLAPRARTHAWIMSMGPTTRALFACFGQDRTFAFLRILGSDRASVVEATPNDASIWTPCVTTFFDYRRNFANRFGS